jgi:hypothetical protein
VIETRTRLADRGVWAGRAHVAPAGWAARTEVCACRPAPLRGTVIDPAVLAGVPRELCDPWSFGAPVVDALPPDGDGLELGCNRDSVRLCPPSAAAKKPICQCDPVSGRGRAGGRVARMGRQRARPAQSAGSPSAGVGRRPARWAPALETVGALRERLSHSPTSISLRGPPVITAGANSRTRAAPIRPFRLAGMAPGRSSGSTSGTGSGSGPEVLADPAPRAPATSRLLRRRRPRRRSRGPGSPSRARPPNRGCRPTRSSSRSDHASRHR